MSDSEQNFGFAELWPDFQRTGRNFQDPRKNLQKTTENLQNMAKSVADYKKEIVRQLKANGTYSKGLDMQIISLASAMRNLEMANAQIDGLTETTVWETTRYGEKLAPHPVFKIAKEAQEMITRQMKALGLTAEELAGGADDDPLADLTKKLNKKRKAPVVIKPGEPETDAQ